MRQTAALIGLAVVMAAGASAHAAASHADRVKQYEGTKTCTACHPKSAKEVAESLHYQQQAEPKFLANWEKGEKAGMMLSY